MTVAEQHYRVLELQPGASLEEIKQAYRDLALVWHPDRFANSPRLQKKALEKMKEINEAYEFLKTYRPDGAAATPAPETVPRPASSPPGRPQPTASEPFSDEVWRYRGHSALVSSVAFAPNGRFVLSGGYDKTVRLWSVGTGLEVRWFLEHTSAVTGVAFAPDGRAALSGSMDRTLHLRDAETKRELQFFATSAVVSCVAFAPDGREIAAGSLGEGVSLWEVGNGRKRARLEIPGYVNGVAFSPEGKRLAAGNADGEVGMYDRSSGQRILSIHVVRERGVQMVNSVAFSPDASLLLTGSPQQIQLWRTVGGREVARIEVGEASVHCLAFTPGGGHLLSGHADGTVRLWDLETRREQKVYTGHTEAVKCIAVSRDGKYGLSGSFDKTMRLWRLPAGV